MSKKILASVEFKKGKNKIGFVSDFFLSEFGNDVLVTKGSVLKSHTLPRYMSDSEIIEELKIQECSLEDVLETLKNATSDMKDGNWNIFYIKGHSRVVHVRWDGGGWHVFDWYRGGHWDEGLRVFSPATSLDSGTLSSSPLNSLTLEKIKNMVPILKINIKGKEEELVVKSEVLEILK